MWRLMFRCYDIVHTTALRIIVGLSDILLGVKFEWFLFLISEIFMKLG